MCGSGCGHVFVYGQKQLATNTDSLKISSHYNIMSSDCKVLRPLSRALIAQLGERSTEDAEVVRSIVSQ